MEEDDPAAVLPAWQPALLTATVDGVLRIWVEVKMATALAPQPEAPSPVALPPRTPSPSPKGSPSKLLGTTKALPGQAATGAAPTATASTQGCHFCVTLVVQPGPGAWAEGQAAMLRAAWGVPLGLGPTTDAQLRAAKVLWIVGVARIPPAGVPSQLQVCHKCMHLSCNPPHVLFS